MPNMIARLLAKVARTCLCTCVLAGFLSGLATSAQAAAKADDPLFFESEDAFCDYFIALKKDPDHPPADPFATHQKKSDGTPFRKGDTYTVYVQTSRAGAVDISEASRDSELESDVKALVSKLLGISSTPPRVPLSTECGDHSKSELKPWSKVLKYNRSTLTLTATKQPSAADVATAAIEATTAANLTIDQTAIDAANAAPAGPDAPVAPEAIAKAKAAAAGKTRSDMQPAANAAAAAGATAAAAGSTVATATVLIGPDEHWFLAVDLPVTKLKTLKYDSANGGTLQPTESSPQFYISLDYQFGDILEPPSKPFDVDRFVIKVMLKASSKPLDSLGVALGYTFPKWGFAGADLSALSVFVGRFWTKQDSIVNGNPSIANSYAQTWRVGISYNFSSALSKVKF